jgi:hypothetical protein
MVDLSEIQAAYYMVAVTGVLVAAGYYILNMRQTIENRKAQLFTQMTSILFTEDWIENATNLLRLTWTDFDDFARKYDSSVNMDHYKKRALVWNYLEQLGYYVKKGQITVEQLNTINGGGFWILGLWDRFGGVIRRYREVLNLPEYYLNFEYLAGEIAKYQRARGYETRIDPNNSNAFAYNPTVK